MKSKHLPDKRTNIEIKRFLDDREDCRRRKCRPILSFRRPEKIEITAQTTAEMIIPQTQQSECDTERSCNGEPEGGSHISETEHDDSKKNFNISKVPSAKTLGPATEVTTETIVEQTDGPDCDADGSSHSDYKGDSHISKTEISEPGETVAESPTKTIAKQPEGSDCRVGGSSQDSFEGNSSRTCTFSFMQLQRRGRHLLDVHKLRDFINDHKFC